MFEPFEQVEGQVKKQVEGEYTTSELREVLAFDQYKMDKIEPSKCPSCDSTRITVVRMPSYHPHYAALKCGECDRFLVWQQKPESEGKRRDIAIRIDRLSSYLDSLSQWEKDFVGNIRGQKKLSPRQMEVLAHLESKLGGAAS